jgi:DNA polymerase beta thumb
VPPMASLGARLGIRAVIHSYCSCSLTCSAHSRGTERRMFPVAIETLGAACNVHVFLRNEYHMCSCQIGTKCPILHAKQGQTILLVSVMGTRAAGRFDRVFGMFRTAAGKVRRMDLVLAPPEETAFATLGWTGSRQFLRFMRAHAEKHGMLLNSHRSLESARVRCPRAGSSLLNVHASKGSDDLMASEKRRCIAPSGL